MIEDNRMKHFLHNQGFPLEKRSFKPLTFSWLIGAYELKGREIHFSAPVTLYVSSPWEPLIASLMEGLVKREAWQLGKNRVAISEVEMVEEPIFSERTKIEALSPITIYSTFTTGNQKKITHFYDMREAAFSELIRKNPVKKRKPYQQDLSAATFSLRPAGRVKESWRRTIRYKSLIIKGWMGRFWMKGNPRLQQLAYTAGLGGKNGIGMGAIKVID